MLCGTRHLVPEVVTTRAMSNTSDLQCTTEGKNIPSTASRLPRSAVMPGVGLFRAAGTRVAFSARLSPGVVILEGAIISAGAVLGPGAVVGPGVHVGDSVRVGAGATLHNCVVGARSVLHPGVRVGQDGFGFMLDADGAAGGHAKKPQGLGVVIGEDVEIGANTCVDRGSWRDTMIGRGTKIDNLVQVGHNCVIGPHCVIAASCGIGGSVTMGERVLVGAMTGILQHTTLGNGAQIAARSGVMSDIPEGRKYGGYPAVPIREFHKQTLALRRGAGLSARSVEGPSMHRTVDESSVA